MNGMYTGNTSKIKFYFNYFKLRLSKVLKTKHAGHVNVPSGNNERDIDEKEKFKEYILLDLALNKTFSEIMNSIIKCNNLNDVSFTRRTKLHENSFSQIKNPNAVVGFEKIVTIC